VSVLIDTSVWISHFRASNAELVELIELDLALIHPKVIAEIACGRPPGPRLQTLGNLGLLQRCEQASLTESMAFIEREKLYGLGCGWVIIVLLAAHLFRPVQRYRPWTNAWRN